MMMLLVFLCVICSFGIVVVLEAEIGVRGGRFRALGVRLKGLRLEVVGLEFDVVLGVWGLRLAVLLLRVSV